MISPCLISTFSPPIFNFPGLFSLPPVPPLPRAHLHVPVLFRSRGSGGSAKTTVGLMMNGLVINNMVVGGPAYASAELQRGDTVLRVDGQPVTAGNFSEAILGSDIPVHIPGCACVPFARAHACARIQ